MQTKIVLRFWKKVDVKGPNECWLWSGCTDAYGRGAFSLEVDGKRKTVKAPRVAFLLEHGCWPEPNCNHTCDTPACCNPAHLYAGTQAENVQDGYARSRRPIGENHHMAVLESVDIPRIWELRSQGWSQTGDREGAGRLSGGHQRRH